MAIGKLTALKVRSLVLPGRYNDGGGLYLQVRDLEHRSWLFRFKMLGQARQMGLGPLHDVPLAEARDAAQRCRKMVRDGQDPIDFRHRQRVEAARQSGLHTFKEVAEFYMAAHKSTWRNEKHRAQWASTLETYVYPVFGSRGVASVETSDVLRVLEPIWREKPETATRVRGRVETVLDYAKARHWRDGENPARWKGHLAHTLPARSKVAKVEHHAALAVAEMAEFMLALRAQDGVGAKALEFAILTAARSGEVFGATWDEIDLSEKLWRIPAERMKAAAEHTVPLSAPALAVLHAIKPAKDLPGGFLFPGQRTGRPLSNMAGSMLIRRMNRDITVHGFRSTFRDWVADNTSYPREIAEAALAHSLKDKTEAAYRRSDLRAKRVQMMDDWGAFCATGTAAADAAQVTE